MKRQIDYILRRKHLIGAFLTELYASTGDSKTVVVRLVYPHQYPEALEWALENEVAIIHLIRENYLKSIVYYLTSKSRRTIRLSPDVLKRRLDERINQVEKFRAMFKDRPYCEVSNEAFVANEVAESQRLLDFLSVDHSRLLTFGVRQQNPELKDILENYEEIAQAFKGTAFEKYLVM